MYTYAEEYCSFTGRYNPGTAEGDIYTSKLLKLHGYGFVIDNLPNAVSSQECFSYLEDDIEYLTDYLEFMDAWAIEKESLENKGEEKEDILIELFNYNDYTYEEGMDTPEYHPEEFDGIHQTLNQVIKGWTWGGYTTAATFFMERDDWREHIKEKIDINLYNLLYKEYQELKNKI